MVNDIFEAHGLCRVRAVGDKSSSIDALAPESFPCPRIRGKARCLVTVIMPCFNVESSIVTSICSVLDQTWRNVEVIAVDDCSTDGTYERLVEISKYDVRIKTLRTRQNSGPYAARNLALSIAAGDLITVCDADDWSHPQKIEIQARHLLSRPRLKGNTTCWLRTSDQLVPARRPYQAFYIQINLSSLMLRRSVLVDDLGGWDEVRFSADSELYKRVQRKYSKRSIHNLATVASISRVRAGSLTHDAMTGYPGYVYGARKDYLESYSLYHASKRPNLYYSPAQRRVYAVPRLMRPDRSLGGSHPFDLMLAGDFRLVSHASLAISCLLAALVDRQKVGLFQLYTSKASPGSRVSMATGWPTWTWRP